MLTFIVDLFHPEPEEIGEEAALHDIVGTSEASVQLCLYYKNRYRLYYCQDLEQESKAIQWHDNDDVATNHKLLFTDICDVNGVPPDLIEQSGNVRLIINGQGDIDLSGESVDHIGGLNIEDFLEALDKIMNALKINGRSRKLSELIVFSCAMAQSTVFTHSISSVFNNMHDSPNIIFFKNVITFMRGHLMSFFDDGMIVEEKIECLSPSTALIFKSTDSRKRKNNENILSFQRLFKRAKMEEVVIASAAPML